MTRFTKYLATAVVAVTLVPGSSATGAPPKPVVMEQAYDAPALGVSVSNYFEAEEHDCARRLGCAQFDVPPGYKYAKVEIVDATGANVKAVVPAVVYGEVCGATTHPLRIEGLDQVTFVIVAGLCSDDETPSTPTSGTVRVTMARSVAALK